MLGKVSEYVCPLKGTENASMRITETMNLEELKVTGVNLKKKKILASSNVISSGKVPLETILFNMSQGHCWCLKYVCLKSPTLWNMEHTS